MSGIPKFHFIEVTEVSPSIADEVKASWHRNKLMDLQTMNERAKEITMLVRNEQGSLAGVSTVRKVKAKLFNNNFLYEFRCFIDPAFRQPALDTQLVIKTKQYLERIRHKDSDPAIGLLMVVENEMLKKWTRTIWAGADFYFAGFTSQGHHIRVSYFDGAMI